MTAVPPPVPPEIVRRAAEALGQHHWDGTGCGTNGTSGCLYCFGPSPADSREVALIAIAAVYGDIIEAARRDALNQAVEAMDRHAGALMGDVRIGVGTWQRDRARGYTAAVGEMLDIVTDLRDATAPRGPLSATHADQRADPRIPGTDGAQIAAEPVFPPWVMQAMDDHQQRAETRMRRLLGTEATP